MNLSENELLAVLSSTVTLIGVVIGWFLSRISDYLKATSDQNQKLKAIQLEVEDIEYNLNYSIHGILERAKECVRETKPIAMSFPSQQKQIAYEEFFKSVLIELSTDYRRNISSFANEVRNYNFAALEIENALRRNEYGVNLAIRFYMVAIKSGKIIGMARWLTSEKMKTRFDLESTEFKEFDELFDETWKFITAENNDYLKH